MQTVYVYFSKVMDVKKFVESISSLDGDFDLIDGMYTVDARSLMGICAMDLTKPIQLRIHKDSKKVQKAIESFVVDEPVEVTNTDEPVIVPTTSKPRLIMEEA